MLRLFRFSYPSRCTVGEVVRHLTSQRDLVLLVVPPWANNVFAGPRRRMQCVAETSFASRPVYLNQNLRLSVLTLLNVPQVTHL
jgi:hypothetical protein